MTYYQAFRNVSGQDDQRVAIVSGEQVLESFPGLSADMLTINTRYRIGVYEMPDADLVE